MNKAKIAAKPNERANGANAKPGNGSNGARRFSEGNRSARALAVSRGEQKTFESAIQRYTDLYEFAPVGYITFDRAGRIKQVNLAACELLEVKREFITGVPFSLLIAQDDLNLFLQHLVRCRSGERRIDTHLHLKKRTGEMMPVILSSTRITDFIQDGNHVFPTAIIDLTKRERAEQALRDKEAELEQIVTQTPFMLTRCTRDLRFRYVSDAYARMVGRAPEDIAGSPLVEIMGPEGLAAVRPYITRVLAGETVSYEAVIPFPNGPHFLHAVYVPDKNTRGEVIGWIASLIDVTERKQAEGAIQRLAAVVHSSADAIVGKDLNGIVTDWNRGAERIFGYKPNEIIGKSILTIIPPERHDEENKILKKMRRGESIDHYETIRLRKDGTPIEVSLTISPIKDAKGKILGISKIAREITEQKRAERRLAEQARLLNLTNDAIIVRDAHDRVVYWNQGAKELYGYTAQQAIGKIIHKLLRTERSDSLKKIQQQLRRDRHWAGELIHRRKDGTKVVVMSRWVLDRDSRGRISSVLETNTDITDRKRAEIALKRSRDLLERLVDQRTRALRMANMELESEISRRKGLEGQILEISDREQERLGQELHDGLCQRLTAIAFMTRATALRLKDHRVADPAELEKIAQLINSSVTDARNIARDLHKEEIDAASFHESIRALTERKIWKTPCRVHVNGDVTLEDDRTACEIFRILREGVINANKHARATEVVIEATRRRRELVFSVTDNGVGFNRKTSQGPKGLGIHIMQYRAQSVGARLEIESPRRGGTRLAVYLPIDK